MPNTRANRKNVDTSSNGPSTSAKHKLGDQTADQTDPAKKSKPAFWSHGFQLQSPSQAGTGRDNFVTSKIGDLLPGGYCNDYIAGRVCHKSTLRAFENSNGICNVFTFDLMDSSSVIRISMFGEQAVANYGNIEMNKCYQIKNLKTKPPNSQFTPNNIKIEGNAISSTVVEGISDQNIPWINFNFIKLAGLKMLQDGSIVDVCAAVVEVSDLYEYHKDGKKSSLRRLKLVDPSETEIICTIWGEDAEQYLIKTLHVVCLKSVQKNTYLGKTTLTACRGTVIWHGCDLAEATQMDKWIKEYKSN